jgi:hypothetical protein
MIEALPPMEESGLPLPPHSFNTLHNLLEIQNGPLIHDVSDAIMFIVIG